MDENIRVSREERERLTRGQSIEFPTYIPQILNLANQNAQSTRANVVGDMSELIEEFEENYPDGTYDDWKFFYLNKNNGDEKLEKSAKKLYNKVEDMREAMEKIDEEMAYEWVKDLVLYKTYMNSDPTEVVIKKLAEVYDHDYEITRSRPPARAKLGDIKFEVVPFEDSQSLKDKLLYSSIPTVYYRINDHDNSIEIDSHELSRELGISIADGEAHSRLDTFE